MHNNKSSPAYLYSKVDPTFSSSDEENEGDVELELVSLDTRKAKLALNEASTPVGAGDGVSKKARKMVTWLRFIAMICLLALAIMWFRSIGNDGTAASNNTTSSTTSSTTKGATTTTKGATTTTTTTNNKNNENPASTSFFVKTTNYKVAPGTSVICWGPILFNPQNTDIGSSRATLIKFIPHVNMNIVHHMVLFGSTDKQLSEQRTQQRPGTTDISNVCWNDHLSKVVYSWARVGQIDGNAINFTVPEGTGFDVGIQGSGATYTSFFLNVHYENRDLPTSTPLNSFRMDSSGFELIVIPRSPPSSPSKLLPLNVIWLHSENIHLEPQKKDVVVCVEFIAQGNNYNDNNNYDKNNQHSTEVVAYREHGHLNARMFYTDVFRQGKIRIGRIGERSAQDAQVYYYVDKLAVQIRRGDVLRLTCHFNTMDKKVVTTFSSSELQGEMCNQYLMGTVVLSPNDIGQSCKTTTTEPQFNVPGKVVKWKNMPTFGEVSSLALLPADKRNTASTGLEEQNTLWVFHRGNGQFWNTNLIQMDTIVSSNDQHWSKNQFIVPHGLYLDRWGFLWATDTALHQVFRIRASTGEIVLTLGTAKTPGNDGTHFNQPTDVALSPDGLFAYVSDGYGNSRVAVYVAKDDTAVLQETGSDNGAFVFSSSWGSFGKDPGQFDTPHSIAVDGRGRVHVADRHNARVQVFAPGGPISGSDGAPLMVWQAPISRVTPWASLSAAQKRTIKSTWLYHVTAICYEPYLDVLFIIEGGDIVMRSVGGDELQRIDGSESIDGTLGALQWPHDVEATVSVDGKYVIVYVAELKGKRIREYQISIQ